MNGDSKLQVAERTQKITFTCTPELREGLEKWAESEGRSLSNLVERIVSAAIDERREQDQDSND